MSDVLNLNITIANRSYPLSVSVEQEPDLKKASHRLDVALSDFEATYGISDKQDALAMIALQFATLLEKQDCERLQIENKLKDMLLSLGRLGQGETEE